MGECDDDIAKSADIKALGHKENQINLKLITNDFFLPIHSYDFVHSFYLLVVPLTIANNKLKTKLIVISINFEILNWKRQFICLNSYQFLI